MKTNKKLSLRVLRTRKFNEVFDANESKCKYKMPSDMYQGGLCHHIDRLAENCCPGGCPRVVHSYSWGNPKLEGE
jgi:hypothetical protein